MQGRLLAKRASLPDRAAHLLLWPSGAKASCLPPRAWRSARTDQLSGPGGRSDGRARLGRWPRLRAHIIARACSGACCAPSRLSCTTVLTGFARLSLTLFCHHRRRQLLERCLDALADGLLGRDDVLCLHPWQRCSSAAPPASYTPAATCLATKAQQTLDRARRCLGTRFMLQRAISQRYR